MEEWQLDEQWCVSNGKFYFSIKDVIFISRECKDAVFIIFNSSAQIKVSCIDETRDQVYEMLKKIKHDYHKASMECAKEYAILQKASVEIQNRFAGHVMHDH